MDAKTSSKPGAGKAGDTKSGAQRAARDLAIFQRRVFHKWAWKPIADEAGLTERQCQSIVKRLENEGGVGMLDRDPTALIEWLLRQHEHDLALFTLAAAEANTSAEMVGALKGREQALGEVRELLQAVGKLPRELGVLRHLIDFRALVDVVVEELTAAGQMEVAERVVDVLRERGVAGLLGRGDG